MSLHYNDFDVIGLIKLNPNEVDGLEKFVTPVKDKDGNISHYLSRSSLYYKDNLTYNERSAQYSYLVSLLDESCDKRDFVIAENILNNSARIFYNEVIKKITSGSNSHSYDMAKSNFLEDCKLVRSILHGEEFNYIPHNTLQGEDITKGRPIEQDNKALIDLFVKSLTFENPSNTTIINPGFGSIYLGPFAQLEHDIPWENIRFSLYSKHKDNNGRTINKKDAKEEKRINIKKGMSYISAYMTNPQQYYGQFQNFVILDDNVGTGDTLKTISKGLQKEFDCSVSQIPSMFNWVGYVRTYNGMVKNNQKVVGDKTVVEDGEKVFEQIADKYNADDYDKYRIGLSLADLSDTSLFRPPLNFPDRHVVKDAINSLTSNSDDGSVYENILLSHGYQNETQSDLKTCKDIADLLRQTYNISSHGDSYQIESPHLVQTENILSDLIEIAVDTPPEQN